MCFIKLGDPLAPCDHEECKKALQALQISQISNCLYNQNKGPQGNSMILKPQPQYAQKRTRPENLSESNSAEENLVKKIKTDSSPTEENGKIHDRKDEQQQNLRANEEALRKFFGMQQNKPITQINPPFLPMKNSHPQPTMMGQANNESQLLNFLLLQNTANHNMPLNNTFPQNFHENPQNVQDSMMNIQLQLNNLQNNLSNVPNANNNNFEGNNQFPSQNNLLISKDFLNKMYSIVILQNQMIMDIKEKNSQIFDGFNKLNSEFNDFKLTIVKLLQNGECENDLSDAHKKTPINTVANNSQQFNIIGVPGETITARDLLHYLYAHKQEKFQFKLIQNVEIEPLLYRERNFGFSVSLVDMNDQPLANTNRIPLSIAIYTYENPPKCLDTNTSGSKILKGNIEKDLVNGYCSFEKIQIKEVTSHFRKGYVFLVVYPKMPTFGNISSGSIQQNFVDFTTIKPLIIEKVVVKAKKINSYKNADTSSQTNKENDHFKEEDLEI